MRELGKHQVEITAPASLVFVGNINVSIETALRTSHLHLLLKLYNHQDVVINVYIHSVVRESEMVKLKLEDKRLKKDKKSFGQVV